MYVAGNMLECVNLATTHDKISHELKKIKLTSTGSSGISTKFKCKWTSIWDRRSPLCGLKAWWPWSAEWESSIC